MIPIKNTCPQCGGDDVILNGRFGAGDAMICNECGCTDFIAGPSEEDDELMTDMSAKKFKLLENDAPTGSSNLIKANKIKAAAKSAPKNTGRFTKPKVSKTRQKR